MITREAIERGVDGSTEILLTCLTTPVAGCPTVSVHDEAVFRRLVKSYTLTIIETTIEHCTPKRKDGN